MIGLLLIAVAVFVCVVVFKAFPQTNQSDRPRPKTMRCPTCGEPAEIHGNTWSCDSCGDSGLLK